MMHIFLFSCPFRVSSLGEREGAQRRASAGGGEYPGVSAQGGGGYPGVSPGVSSQGGGGYPGVSSQGGGAPPL